ncbi:META domain-containing protein [Olivibacter sitiensis]|uniref:META domain-containing protein n=1 Tax=Olivibacter sitiensis TaxID=376470 RepID=UPI00048120D5|nr:META domain-containing protein [Olivibacter sitiensis]
MEKKYFNVYLFLAATCMLLMNTCASKKAATTGGDLTGSWELEYITGPRIAFDGLYPNRKPEVNFDASEKRASGNTGCNTFSGGYTQNGDGLSFSKNMIMTKMFCQGDGEQVFVSTLEKVKTYKLNGEKLSFYDGDVELMRFHKKL